MNIIDGDGFENIAKNTDGVEYVETHDLSDYLYSGEPIADIVVSHNSDGNIVKENPRDFDCEWIPDRVPKNLRRLYAQNCLVEDPRIVPIPIGLERIRWNPDKRKHLKKLMDNPMPKAGLACMCHEISTNPEERQEPYDLLSVCGWMSAIHGKNGDDFKKYITHLARHTFVISPDGNGSETHRTYEALCVGTIPIVKESVWAKKFSLLFPMVIVKSWAQVEYQLLEREMVRLRSKMDYFKYLDISWWEKLIKKGRTIDNA